jgi:hypothetical protein
VLGILITVAVAVGLLGGCLLCGCMVHWKGRDFRKIGEQPPTERMERPPEWM